jgi:hypothetical protein
VKEEQSTLTIYYPRRQGCILEAHTLQQKIRANFDLSVAIEEHEAQSFALVLDGAAIFSDDISDCTGIDHATLLGLISAHEKPLAKIGDSASEDSEESNDNDPDHRRWLNSVCSGE